MILRRAEEGVFADALLDEARAVFDARDSALLLELVYGVLRNRTLLDSWLNQLSARPLDRTDAWTRNILRLGAYQLLFLDRIPPSAAVNTAVELAKTRGRKQGYINGLLRNLDRKRSELAKPGQDDPVRRLSVLFSHPAWLVRRWVARYGVDAAEKILAKNNEPAPLVIRANRLRTSRERLRSALRAEGVESRETAYAPDGLELGPCGRMRALAAYQEGLFMVQDEAAQLISLMLAPAPGAAVLDACAAPGGKATHIAELMSNRGAVTALENDPVRIGKISENSSRLGTTIVAPVPGDARAYQGGPFDHLLIDAPCTGLGVLRRHPDGRWSRNEEHIRERAAVQRAILAHCAGLLQPGGSLVYATCTTEPEENEEIIDAFLEGQGANFRIDDPRPYLPEKASEFVDTRGFLRTHRNNNGMDGFFGARLLKKG